MVDAATAASLAEATAVVVAVLFGAAQLRQFQRRRRDGAALEVVHSVQSTEFRTALETVMSIPDGADAAEVESSPERMEALNQMAYICETLGVLVYYRIVPLRVLDHLLGGAYRRMWRKMRPYAEFRRRRDGLPNWYEWVQWLAERLEENPTPGKAEGAHVSYRAWTP